MVYAPGAILINEKVSVVELKKSGIKETPVLASSLPQFAEFVTEVPHKCVSTGSARKLCQSPLICQPHEDGKARP